jgi:small subunit ribosomal protein S18
MVMVKAKRIRRDKNMLFPRRRVKFCRICRKKMQIDYKDSEFLKNFISERGKILSRRVTGNCAKHQRQVAFAIKRARVISLLPYVKED